MENLTAFCRKEKVKNVMFCNCCCSYRDLEQVFNYEGCYKFCLDCATDNKLNVVNDMAATFNDQPIDFKGINNFINEKIKSFNPYLLHEKD